MKYISIRKGKVSNVYSSARELYEDAGADKHLEMENDDFEKYQKDWRDSELKNTDWIISVSDHSQRDAYITYRQELRDWPSTNNFPDIIPTM